MSFLSCFVVIIAAFITGIFAGAVGVYYNVIILPQRRLRKEKKNYPRAYIKPKK